MASLEQAEERVKTDLQSVLEVVLEHLDRVDAANWKALLELHEEDALAATVGVFEEGIGAALDNRRARQRLAMRDAAT